MSVTAFSGEMLADSGYTDMSALGAMTPGLHFEAFDATRPLIYVRGIGTRAYDAGSDPSVGVAAWPTTGRMRHFLRRTTIRLTRIPHRMRTACWTPHWVIAPTPGQSPFGAPICLTRSTADRFLMTPAPRSGRYLPPRAHPA